MKKKPRRKPSVFGKWSEMRTRKGARKKFEELFGVKLPDDAQFHYNEIPKRKREDRR